MDHEVRAAFYVIEISSSTSTAFPVAGSLNFSQTGMTVSSTAQAVKMKGKRGLIRSYSWAPIAGAGSETTPRLVLNRPKAVPRVFSGTALLISDW